MSTAAILLAAGRGSRLGGTTPKALVSLGNQALLCKTLEHYLEASAIDRVIVVLGYGAAQIRSHLPTEHRMTVVVNPHWQDGLSTSIRLGMQALGRDTTTVVVGLGDMPWISPEILDELAYSCESSQRIVAPFFQGTRGNPVAFPASHFESLRQLQGDRGAASLLKSYDVLPLDVEEPGILRDIDLADDIPPPLPRVVVRGDGYIVSGVARRLYAYGFPVLIMAPSTLFASEIQIEGVLLRHYTKPPSDWRSALPVVIDPQGACLASLLPEVLVDARMLGKPDGIAMSLAPLVVALGPGIYAGRDCHRVVETARGEALGKVVWHGQAAPHPNPGPEMPCLSERISRIARGVLEAITGIPEKISEP